MHRPCTGHPENRRALTANCPQRRTSFEHLTEAGHRRYVRTYSKYSRSGTLVAIHKYDHYRSFKVQLLNARDPEIGVKTQEPLRPVGQSPARISKDHCVASPHTRGSQSTGLLSCRWLRRARLEPALLWEPDCLGTFSFDRFGSTASTCLPASQRSNCLISTARYLATRGNESFTATLQIGELITCQLTSNTSNRGHFKALAERCTVPSVAAAKSAASSPELWISR